MRKTAIIIASMMVLCVLIFLTAIAWFMLFQGEVTAPTEEEKKVAILQAAGLFKTDSQGKKSIESLYQRAIVMRTLNLDSGEWVTDKTAAQRCTKLTPEQDPAQIRQRCTLAEVYLVKDKYDKIQQVIIPVSGKGAKSMMHAFLSLGLDGRTVNNLYYYQQRETPFLGARVKDESWRQQWPGKKVADDNGSPALKIVQKKSVKHNEYTVDGISGATLTSTGVERSINYWISEQGYGPFLQRLKQDPEMLYR